MKLEFFWRKQFDYLFPTCGNHSKLTPKCDPLSAILADDGGHGLDSIVEWVGIGIDNIKQVMEGTIESYDWDCELYDATITKEQTSVFYSYDSSYESKLPSEDFLRIMMEWHLFIQQPASLTTTKTIEW